MDKQKTWPLLAVIFVVLLAIVVKTSRTDRHSSTEGTPGTETVTSAENTSERAAGSSSAGRVGATAAASAEGEKTGESSGQGTSVASSSSRTKPETAPAPGAAKRPKMLELGSVTCHACQEMQPIIEELKAELKGKVDIVFIDVVKHGDVADRYGIQVIPTQIFLDAEGREVYRHVGFYPKEDILAKIRELGFLP